MGHHHDVQTALREPYRELGELVPGVTEAFGQLAKAAFAEGALPASVKELMGLVVAIVDGCDGCLAAHARGAARRGATRQEVAEAIGVAIAMRGGPGTVWGPRALEAFDEFSKA